MEKGKDFIEIDLLLVLKALWKKLWLVILITVIGAGAAFGITTQFMTPQYEATALLYVNNSSVSIGQTKLSISSADISAAQSLVDTYIVILQTRTVLEEVIQVANSSRTYEELRNMVSAAPCNETEIIKIAVESPDPEEARTLANTITRVLPNEIAYIIDGASVKTVEYAVTPRIKSSPDVTKSTAIGGLLGLMLICIIIGFQVIMDNKIHDESYLLEEYDIPVLANIPELSGKDVSKRKKNGYYYYGGETLGGELRRTETGTDDEFSAEKLKNGTQKV